MADGYAELDRMIETMRKLGTARTAVATAATPLIDVAVKASASAGTAPNGSAWEPKADGGRALSNAASAVEARKVGETTIQIRIIGNATGSQKVQAIQHFGTRRIPARQMIPRSGDAIPRAILDALLESSHRFFTRTVGGR